MNSNDTNVGTEESARLIDAPTLAKTEFHPPVSERWIRGLCAEKKIPFLRVGGKVLFDRARVRRALQQNFAVE